MPSCSPGAHKQQAPDLRAIFKNAPEEDLKPTRWDSGNTSISNENRIDLFKNHIANLGGGYVGVGTTQNFTMSAWARSEWIWLIDYTKITVAANKIHIAFLKHSPAPENFESLWQQGGTRAAMDILDTEYPGSPELPYLKTTWGTIAHFVRWHMSVLRRVTGAYNYDTWFTDPAIYGYIRSMALKGRIIALRGDLQGPATLKGIADNAKKMGVTVRVIYFSNAEEFFTSYNENFVGSLRAMPIDGTTMVLRTMAVLDDRYPWAPGSEIQNSLGFHYNVMNGETFVRLLPEKKGKWIFEIVKYAAVDRKNGFSIILPEHVKAAAKEMK